MNWNTFFAAFFGAAIAVLIFNAASKARLHEIINNLQIVLNQNLDKFKTECDLNLKTFQTASTETVGKFISDLNLKLQDIESGLSMLPESINHRLGLGNDPCDFNMKLVKEEFEKTLDEKLSNLKEAISFSKCGPHSMRAFSLKQCFNDLIDIQNEVKCIVTWNSPYSDFEKKWESRTLCQIEQLIEYTAKNRIYFSSDMTEQLDKLKHLCSMPETNWTSCDSVIDQFTSNTEQEFKNILKVIEQTTR